MHWAITAAKTEEYLNYCVHAFFDYYPVSSLFNSTTHLQVYLEVYKET